MATLYNIQLVAQMMASGCYHDLTITEAPDGYGVEIVWWQNALIWKMRMYCEFGGGKGGCGHLSCCLLSSTHDIPNLHDQRYPFATTEQLLFNQLNFSQLPAECFNHYATDRRLIFSSHHIQSLQISSISMKWTQNKQITCACSQAAKSSLVTSNCIKKH